MVVRFRRREVICFGNSSGETRLYSMALQPDIRVPQTLRLPTSPTPTPSSPQMPTALLHHPRASNASRRYIVQLYNARNRQLKRTLYPYPPPQYNILSHCNRHSYGRICHRISFHLLSEITEEIKLMIWKKALPGQGSLA